ncbi:MAG: ABC transporter ATP-binding protein [Firmicutes bacterium]|nr:ABC transporter ATP-binding protein [Bacillota bacterium]
MPKKFKNIRKGEEIIPRITRLKRSDKMKQTFRNLKKVYEYGKEQWKNMFIFCLLSFIFMFVSIIYPIFTARQLTSLTSGMFGQLMSATLVILCFEVLSAIKTVIIKKNTQLFFRGTFRKLQLAVSKEILRIRVKDLDDNSSGLFIERLTQDCNELANIYTAGVGHLTGVLTNAGVFVAVFIISKWVFLFYLICSLIVTWLYMLKVKKVNIKDKLLRQQKEKNIGLTGELVRGVRDIKMLNAKDSFIKEIENSINNLSDKNFDMRNTDMAFNCIIKTSSAIFETLLVVFLICLISINNITIATAVVLYSYRRNIMVNLMEQIGSLSGELKRFNLSCSRIFSMFDESEFKKEKFGTKHLKKVDGNFEFKNVTFGYTEDHNVLNDLSFKVNANETVGFVGKSGVGKTTIFNLLCKMYDLKDGEILIDGVNIEELDEDSIRGNITIISQNPYIFNMSIRDNLRLVKSDLTEKEMKKACKLACLDDYIESLPEKYDTIVGEGGVMLSGGQRQRLAIARAFIQKTEIILFDEATSALDNDTQSKIQQAIDNLKREYTILIIAHRFSTIINCDRIYYIEDGKVVDSGKHSELLNKCLAYKKLYESEIKENK